MTYTCPVCFYGGMTEPPQDYNICECCGTEFGYDDEFRSHDELRTEWIALGAKWFYGTPPANWNPWKQSRTPAYVCISTKSSACRNMVLAYSGAHVHRETPGRQVGVNPASKGSIEVFAYTQRALHAVAF